MNWVMESGSGFQFGFSLICAYPRESAATSLEAGVAPRLIQKNEEKRRTTQKF
jgi:hypothetical protein